MQILSSDLQWNTSDMTPKNIYEVCVQYQSKMDIQNVYLRWNNEKVDKVVPPTDLGIQTSISKID
jgi:hypothetical protein